MCKWTVEVQSRQPNGVFTVSIHAVWSAILQFMHLVCLCALRQIISRREALRRAIINNSEYHEHDYNYRTRGSEERQRGRKKEAHEMAHHASDTTRRRMSRTAEQSSPSSVLDLPTAEGGCHIRLVLNVSASRRPLRDCGAAGPSPRTQHCWWNSEETRTLRATTHHPAIKDQLSASKAISVGDVG